MLINYGDFVEGNTSNTAAPYVQLLSTTDPASAHADFLSVRPNHYKGAFSKKKITIIIVSSVAVGLVLLGVGVFMCTRNRRSKRERGGLASTYRPYQHIGAPAPAGDMRPVSGYDYAPQQQPYAHPNPNAP